MGLVLVGRSVFDLLESLTLDVSGSKCPPFEAFGDGAPAVCEGFLKASTSPASTVVRFSLVQRLLSMMVSRGLWNYGAT